MKIVKFVRFATIATSPINRNKSEARTTPMIATHGVFVFLLTLVNTVGNPFCSAIPYTNRDPLRSIAKEVLNVEKRAMTDSARKLFSPNHCCATRPSGAFEEARSLKETTLTAARPTRM